MKFSLKIQVRSSSILKFYDDLQAIISKLLFIKQHLHSKYQEIHYFSEKGECDFIAVEKGEATEIVQVCYELNPDNLDRELNGLFEVLDFFLKRK